MRKRLLEVAPWCEIQAITEIFTMSEAERLLAGNPTYVLDCIDDTLICGTIVTVVVALVVVKPQLVAVTV